MIQIHQSTAGLVFCHGARELPLVVSIFGFLGSENPTHERYFKLNIDIFTTDFIHKRSVLKKRVSCGRVVKAKELIGF